MDYLTQRIPVNDTLRVFGFNEFAADKIILRMKTTQPELVVAIGNKMQVNGFGQPKLCADLKTMIQIVLVLPRNGMVIAFRSKCAEDLAHQMTGDLTLIQEIMHNHAVLEETGGLHFHESRTAQPRSSAIDAALPDDALRNKNRSIEIAEMVAFWLEER